MTLSSKRAKATKVVAALAAAASLGSLIVSTPTPAGADPRAVLVGTGSDTTQDVMNALAGFNNGVRYQPLQSSDTSGNTRLTSWDAILGATGTCITPKPGATFSRPNGSTNGRKALSRSLDGAKWTVGGSTCAGEVVTPPALPGQGIGGLVDFARSSAAAPVLAATTAPDTDPSALLTYLPFGRDALSFAYYRPNSSLPPITTLTTAELNQLFTVGPQTIGGVRIIPCSIQRGSGTYQSWNTATGATPFTATTPPGGTMQAATTLCRTASGVTAPGEIQENDANSFKARGDLIVSTQPAEADSQFVIGYSAANFIAQKNGASPDQTSTAPTVDLGAIDALGKPYTGTAPNLLACGTAAGCTADFYANTKYGRTVYNVVSTARLGGSAAINANMKTLFLPGSATGADGICGTNAQVIIRKFGFSPDSLPAIGLPGSCGYRDPTPTTTLPDGTVVITNDTERGALISGAGTL